MTTSTMKMPASYSAIEAEEMTYLDGGASNAYPHAYSKDKYPA